MKPFDTGFVWDPSDPDAGWPRTLQPRPVTGAGLTRTIAFTRLTFCLPAANSTFSSAIRHLQASVTLFDCFEREQSESFANAVIVGCTASAIRRSWSRPPSLKIAGVLGEKVDGDRTVCDVVGRRRQLPDPVDVHADADMRISIRSAALSSFEQWRVSIDEEI